MWSPLCRERYINTYTVFIVLSPPLLLFAFHSMDRKTVDEAANESRMFSTDEMRRSFWELDYYLDEILRKTTVVSDDVESETRKTSDDAIGGSAGEICARTDDRFQDSDVFLGDDCSAGINSTFDNRDMKNPLLSCGKLAENYHWAQKHTPKHSSISATIDSQSSICVASPPSANQPTGQSNQGANSSSSHELSNDEDGCEQSTDPVSDKRIRRKLSNRDSARRSRRRKQAHLTELECQVVNLQEENASLYKHLTDASQLYRDANTNNRVLKSDVEALRAKVKLAEDMLARGSLSYSLTQLLQNHLNVAMEPQLNALRTKSNVSPTMSLQGDGVSYAAMTASGQNSGHRLGSRDTSSMIDDIKSSMTSDDLSGVSAIWP